MPFYSCDGTNLYPGIYPMQNILALVVDKKEIKGKEEILELSI